MSFNKSLMRAFGNIKFKVRIFIKSAQCGINIYVFTDEKTVFILKVIIYSGKYNYSNNESIDILKTVKVVYELCKPFEGSHCTFFVDCFYNSIPLTKELDKIEFYVTGTVMTNILPSEVKTNKTPKNPRR